MSKIYSSFLPCAFSLYGKFFGFFARTGFFLRVIFSKCFSRAHFGPFFAGMFSVFTCKIGRYRIFFSRVFFFTLNKRTLKITVNFWRQINTFKYTLLFLHCNVQSFLPFCSTNYWLNLALNVWNKILILTVVILNHAALVASRISSKDVTLDCGFKMLWIVVKSI